MRLFVAIDLPPDVLHNVEALLDRLRPMARISWSLPENLHITTKFIGQWPEERLDELKTTLAAIEPRAPFRVHIHKVGFFPNPHSPRVFWCGIDAPELGALAQATDRATASLGVASETRVFSPHLTLARIKDRVDMQPLRQTIAALPSLDFGEYTVDRFFLYLSKPHSGGSVYTKLAEFPFAHK